LNANEVESRKDKGDVAGLPKQGGQGQESHGSLRGISLGTAATCRLRSLGEGRTLPITLREQKDRFLVAKPK